MEPGVITDIINNLKVDGSNPSRGTKKFNKINWPSST